MSVLYDYNQHEDPAIHVADTICVMSVGVVSGCGWGLVSCTTCFCRFFIHVSVYLLEHHKLKFNPFDNRDTVQHSIN